jgi:hypothetical protein
MATEIRPTNSADVVRVAPVARGALVVSADPVVPVERVALVVSEDPVVPAARAALVVSEDPAVPVELELVRAAAALVRGHPRARLAVALRIKSVTEAHRPDLVLLLAGEDLTAAVAEITREPAVAEEATAWEAADTAAAAAADTAAAAADTVAVAAEEDIAVAAAAAAVDAAAAADAEDRRRIDG